MMLHLFWVVLSLFAVIGLLDCVFGALELIALRRVKTLRSATVRVVLTGGDPGMEYLLNTLSLRANRLDLGSVEAVLEVVDGGLTPEAKQEVRVYCEKNPWVVFTDGSENDII